MYKKVTYCRSHRGETLLSTSTVLRCFVVVVPILAAVALAVVAIVSAGPAVVGRRERAVVSVFVSRTAACCIRNVLPSRFFL